MTPDVTASDDTRSRQVARECPLAANLAEQLRSARNDLTSHWLSRISDRVSIDKLQIFPSDELLDHVPLLIDGIAAYLEQPAAEIRLDAAVVAKAMELGELRHSQGFDAYEILKEYEILGGILFNYLAQAVDEIDEPCEKSELLACGQRLFRAVTIIQEATTTHFLRLAHEQVKEREERLRAFNRAVSHEIKNRIGTVLGAADALHELPHLSPGERAKFVDIIRRNTRAMHSAVTNILLVSRTEHDPRAHRNVRLPEAVQESVRQVREGAHAAGIEIRVAGEMPDVEVNAAAVELCLTNYLSNAIKYADASRERSWVEVSAILQQDTERDGMIVVRVRDNGLGVPVEKRARLFERFYRAHEGSVSADGTGLGLSIVRDTVRALGGEAWAEFPGEGSAFAFSLPHRRSGERRSARAKESELRSPARP